MSLKWKVIDESILFAQSSKFVFKNKVAGFDCDGTLIENKSGMSFPQNEDDWIFAYSTVASKLKQLYDNDYCICIISNQNGLIKLNKIDEFQNKLNKIIKKLKIPVIIYAPLLKDKYRKPQPNIFNDFILKNIDKLSKDSFYCGDAIGRVKDHSACDILFAYNCGLTFYSPEQMFLDDTKIYKPIYPNLDYKGTELIIKPSIKDLIVMVGFPASGKSYCSKVLHEKHNYHIINQDTLKTKAKCIKLCKELMKLSQNIIIDNTNPTIEVRSNYIKLAQEFEYNIRCIHVITSQDISIHNNYYRHFYLDQPLIPIIVYNKYNKIFEEPSKDEGFNEIIKYHPNKPDDINYMMYFDI